MDLALHFGHLVLKLLEDIGCVDRMNDDRDVKYFFKIENRFEPTIS